ncbi:AGE family epimerase/isomerase [Parvularcula maris]|uniref:AGE family epimerase/isomerase n=1 Tax=Parvularcula maris TaxID=2965077 RepID=A0A9X2L6R8_9PROT|nr:AGE family epimerase/isomerase [Parvularcula maris]MCQ8184174.1 AGE family epimerase/isomerase [Parvularcula maris]
MTTYHEQREWFLAWVRDDALPLWSSAALDPRGGYHESLTHNGEPVVDAPKRWRVQARQAFSFARAELLGLMADGRAASDHGWRFMIDRGLLPKEGFVPSFVHVFSPEGEVLNDTRDGYDHTFALLASAERRAVYDDPEAEEVDSVVEGYFSALRHEHGGYAEAFPPSLPRRQNPHMHLFEASTLRLEAGASAFAEEAQREVLSLYHEHFWDPDRGVLLEFFTEDWIPDPRKGALIEPGHMTEWLWLLQRAGETDLPHLVTLYENARRLGRIGRYGILSDEVDLAADEALQTGRLWCQTEHIRAAATLGRLTGEAAYHEEAGRLLETFVELYLAPVAKGGWVDRLNADGSAASELMPTSLLYHIITLADELLAYDG